MINEVQVDPKNCKHYLPNYDVIFVDDHHDLRFCRYCKHPDASISGKYHMVVKDNDQIFDYITKDRALCFYDRDRHRWCSEISDYRLKYWEVVGPEDNIFINILVGIAIDEISKIKTDYLSVDGLTHHIKSRFGIWFDEYIRKCSWDSLANRADKSLFYEKARSELKKSLNEVYGIRGQKSKLTPPQPKLLQFNGDYTTVVWEDGSHTVVKRCADENPDNEKALLFAIVKHLCKDNGCETDRYLMKFFKHVKILHREDKNDKKDNSEDNN